MRTAAHAVAYSRRYTTYRTQYCLNFVQTMLGAPWAGPSAVVAWSNAKGKHGPDPHPPAGVPVWILGSKYGHIALSVGGGRCRSTDYPGRGQVGEVGIQELARRWGRTYVGWAEYLGGEKIPGVGTAAPSTPAAPAAHRTAIEEFSMFIGHSQHNKDHKILVGPTSARRIEGQTYHNLVSNGVRDTGKVVTDETIRDLSDTGSAAGGVAAPGVDTHRGPG